VPRFVAGVVRFQDEVLPGKRALFEKLSQGQSPEALFITCSDSRIDTSLITQTEPGELFVIRNAGNIVPAHSTETGGMVASIEFAVSALEVPHIVVCGHTGCGAMKGAMDLAGLAELPNVREWLGYAKAAVDVVNELGQGRSDDERMRMLLEQNVLLQLQHLKTHPSVAAKLANGTVQLHGWIYDIKTGGVDAFDEVREQFVPLGQCYADELTAPAGASQEAVR